MFPYLKMDRKGISVLTFKNLNMLKQVYFLLCMMLIPTGLLADGVVKGHVYDEN